MSANKESLISAMSGLTLIPYTLKPSTKSAEDFINTNELRHLLYEQIAFADNADLSNCTSFLMSSPIINAGGYD